MTEIMPEITEEQVRAAEAAEQSALEEAQKTHMQKRVVLLRVQLDAARLELAQSREEVRFLRDQLEGSEPSTD